MIDQSTDSILGAIESTCSSHFAFKEQNGAMLTDKEYLGSGGVYQWRYFKADEGKRDPSSYGKASLSCNGSPTCIFCHLRQQDHLKTQMKDFKVDLLQRQCMKPHFGVALLSPCIVMAMRPAHGSRTTVHPFLRLLSHAQLF